MISVVFGNPTVEGSVFCSISIKRDPTKPCIQVSKSRDLHTMLATCPEFQNKDLEQTKNVIANYFVKEPIGKYANVLKDSKKMIGAIEFRVDDWNKSGVLGFTLNRHFWGNGYMTEAGKLILRLAFEVLGLERVYAAHEVKNKCEFITII